jgi:RNA polymerase sigma-70 factor, ECF subfamily
MAALQAACRIVRISISGNLTTAASWEESPPMPTDPDNRDELLPSDVDLMAQVQQGSQDAFVTLIRRHQGHLLNFFRHMGVNHDAEDLAQDTFVRLFKYRFRYEPRARFTTFLYLMARQVLMDRWRKVKRYAAALSGYAEETRVNEQHGKPPDGLSEEVQRALDQLPEPMRAVVVMSIYQGLKYEEIAKILDIPVGTVKSRMFNALGRLREVLHEE